MKDRTLPSGQHATINLDVLSGPACSAEARHRLALEGFELIGELGGGGMGFVYKAYEEKLKRAVALKMIRAGQGAHPDEIARFVREAESAAQLSHDNIVRVFRTGEAAGVPFIALEYVDGPTLGEHWNSAPQPPKDVAALVRTLARAIQHAHDHGIIHRDLKPGNVLLANVNRPRPRPSRDDTMPAGGLPVPKVSDFGLAKHLDDGFGLSLSGQVIGTPSYMAPEQAAGRRDVGSAADIWSLGAILYCGLTGRAPFRGETDIDTMGMVRFQEPVPPRRLQPTVPIDLETICLKCLQKEPARRYESAQLLADDLAAFLEQRPIQARPVGRVERMWRWCKRNPKESALISAILFLVAFFLGVSWGLTGWALQERKRVEQEKATQRRQTYAAQVKNAHQDYKEARLVEMVRRLNELRPSSGEKDLRGFEWAYLDSLTRLDFANVPSPGGDLHALATSPDGRRIAFAGDRAVIWIWDAAERREVMALKAHQARVRSLAFHADGRHLASTGFDGVVKVWDLDSGNELARLEGQTGTARAVAYTDDGRWLAAGGVDRVVRIWDATTGKLCHKLSGHSDLIRSVRFSADGHLLAVACRDGAVKIWDLVRGREGPTVHHDGPASAVAFSPDGRLLASAGDDRAVRVWHTETGAIAFNLWGHGAEVTGVAFSPDGLHLASSALDRTARVWELAEKRQILLLAHDNALWDVAYHPDGMRLISLCAGGVKIWDAIDSQRTQVWVGHTGAVECATYRPDGKWLATGGADEAVRLWDTETGEQALSLEEHTGTVRRLAFGPGECLASVADDGTLRLWDLLSRKAALRLGSDVAAARGLGFGPDGAWVAAVGRDGTLRRWDTHTGAPLSWPAPCPADVKAIAISPDGQRLAWIDPQGAVRVWRTAGADVLSLPAITDAGQLAFTPDGRRLACAAASGSLIEVWDAVGGRPLTTLRGHRGGVAALCFTPDGERLAAVGQVGVTLWDAVTGEEIIELDAPGAGARYSDVCFRPDGLQMACASTNWAVRVWDARADDPGSRARREARMVLRSLFGHGLSEAEAEARVGTDRTLGEAVRQEAVALAASYGDRLIRCEAARLVQTLFGQGLLREEVLQRLRTDRSLGEPVRRQALALAGSAPENAAALADASWWVVRNPGASGQVLARAVRQAEAAYRITPREGLVPTALAVAYLRVGRLGDAIRVAEQAEILCTTLGFGPFPPDLAVLAMAHERLGHRVEAQDALKRLRRSMADPRWAGNPDTLALYDEAETALKAPL